MTYRFKQCVHAIAFKYFNENYPNDHEDAAIDNNFQRRGSFQKLKFRFCKTNTGQLALSEIGSKFRNKTPDKDT